MYPLNECAHWLLLVPLGHPPMIKGLAPPFVKVTSHEAAVPACVPLMKNVAVRRLVSTATAMWFHWPSVTAAEEDGTAAHSSPVSASRLDMNPRAPSTWWPQHPRQSVSFPNSPPPAHIRCKPHPMSPSATIGCIT